jgi:hypothetical protein
MKEELTTSGRPRGPLSKLSVHCKIAGLSEGALRALIKVGKGPPLFKRPGSNRFVGYPGETQDWVEADRPKSSQVA